MRENAKINPLERKREVK